MSLMYRSILIYILLVLVSRRFGVEIPSGVPEKKLERRPQLSSYLTTTTTTLLLYYNFYYYNTTLNGLSLISFYPNFHIA